MIDSVEPNGHKTLTAVSTLTSFHFVALAQLEQDGYADAHTKDALRAGRAGRGRHNAEGSKGLCETEHRSVCCADALVAAVDLAIPTF